MGKLLRKEKFLMCVLGLLFALVILFPGLQERIVGVNSTNSYAIATVSSVTPPSNGTYKAGTNLDFTVNFTTAVAANLPLDRVTGAAAAYGLRKLKSDVTGSAIRVRRSSDDTEQDIGFVGSELDTTSLSSFVGTENLNKQSEAFTVTWSNSLGITVTDNQTTAPNGTNTAASVYETATTALHQPYQQITSTTGSAYTYSMYVKDGNRRYFRLRVNYGGDTFYAIADLQSGTIVSGALGAATIIGATITPSTNGFYRITVTGSCPHSNVFYGYGPYYQSTYGTDQYAGDASKYLYVWGAQSNSGTSANIYNKTVAGIGGNGFVKTWYDQSGNGKNASQSTNGNQPRIVNAGVLETKNNKPSVYFNATNSNYMVTANLNMTSVSSSSVFSVVSMENTATTNQRIYDAYLTGQGSLGRPSGYLMTRENLTNNWLLRGAIIGNGGNISGSLAPTYGAIFELSHLHDGAGLMTKVRVNGVLDSQTTNSGNNLQIETFTLFASGSPGGYGQGNMSEFIVYQTALLDINRQAIEDNQGGYFGITTLSPTTTGLPTLPIKIGSTTMSATYTTGSATTALTFRYTVQAGENGNVTTNGSITTAAIYDAGTTSASIISLNNVGSTASVFADTTSPTVISVTPPATAML